MPVNGIPILKFLERFIYKFPLPPITKREEEEGGEKAEKISLHLMSKREN